MRILKRFDSKLKETEIGRWVDLKGRVVTKSVNLIGSVKQLAISIELRSLRLRILYLSFSYDAERSMYDYKRFGVGGWREGRGDNPSEAGYKLCLYIII